MSGPARTASGGCIDRKLKIRFKFNGRTFAGHPGDTLASALLANGLRLVARSFKYHRPRGLMAAGLDEPNVLVQLGRYGEAQPNLKATEIELFDGLEARIVNCWPTAAFDLRAINQLFAPFLGAGFYYKTFMWPNWRLFEGAIRRAAGLGVAPRAPDPDRYVHQFVDCDTLVVGAGPAGLSSAVEAAESGEKVIVAEADFRLGGSSLWRGTPDNAAALEARLRALTNVKLLTRTNVFGYFDHNALAAVEHLGGGGAQQRLWKIRARRVVLATGAIERPLVFANNDRPGVMLASAAQAFVRRWGVLPGKQVVLFTNNDGAYEAAVALREAGASITIVDSRPRTPPLRDVRVYCAHRVSRVKGRRSVKAVILSPVAGGADITLPCDLLLMSGGWSPTVHLFSQSGGTLRFDEHIQAFVPDRAIQAVTVIGGAAGGLGELGIEPLWEVPGGGPKFVDFANDVTVNDIGIARSENYVSVEHLKRYTTLGMGIDQGKTSNVNGLAIMGGITGRRPDAVGTTKFRPPYAPVTFGALAGPLVGDLYRSIKHLPAHVWHAEQGAVFEEYGGWCRPTSYPQTGETWEEAAQREARTARTHAALFDASPLGKIEVVGKDAGTFLDRIYVGLASTLKLRSARYGLMLNENGVIIDDGVFVRLSEDRFLVHTTSGGADHVALMLEEWLQCEWPKLDVAVLPVTKQWATLTLSGPLASYVLGNVEADFNLADFPHMTFREGRVGGIDARVLRASFTGEISYEISIPARRALELVDRIESAGASLGLVPIGIEALMILRTEKGYLHVGVDTDGTTIPADVGLGQAVARKTSDFIGRRSLGRRDALRTDRLQLVGLEASGEKLPVGAHVLHEGHVPGPIDGYITSSYHSPTLGRPVALGMVRSGRDRIGEHVTLYDMGSRFVAQIVEPPFVDKEGERLRG